MSDCLFCSIVAGDIPADKVHEDDEMLAFRDINPQAPTHILIIPKRHVASLAGTADTDAAMLGKALLLAKSLAAREGIEEGGYRLVNNCGARAGQTVFHIHFHLLGGRAFGWPPG
jgi:histidine triad (HIT) family protein